jgi:hypothetical protein
MSGYEPSHGTFCLHLQGGSLQTVSYLSFRRNFVEYGENNLCLTSFCVLSAAKDLVVSHFRHFDIQGMTPVS